jgi:hypothetical protein
METHLMYDGKKYEIQGHVEHGNGSLTVDLKPVREVPPEPPRGSVYADDRGRPWWRVGNFWFSSSQGGTQGLRWETLLRRTSLYPMVLVPEGKSAVVFNGGFSDKVEHGNFHSRATLPRAGDHYYRGYSDMEAPVHGYFEKVSDE